MTNQEILRIALEQSAIDSNCRPEDFLSGKQTVVLSQPHPDARRYLKLPFFCDLTTYGNNIVASVSEEIVEPVKAYIEKYTTYHCFETPNLLVLMEILRPYGYDVCFQAEYFLPDVELLRPLDCPYPTKWLTPDDFTDLYRPEWSNALCEERKHLDVLGIGAYDGDKLVGFAACSADCDTMWQIGIDVLPEYRRKGIASALTSRLALEILNRGKVPFYCCAWSNLQSSRNAIKSGFRPAWVTLTAKKKEFIDQMNR